MASIRENLAAVRERVEAASRRAGRDPRSVLLLAVCKKQPAAAIREAYEAGQRHFAENQVQEFEQKRAGLDLPHAEWHLIGHLQSNKARRAATLFQVIETVDSIRLARRLNDAARDLDAVRLRVMIEVKLSAEPSKEGCSEQELPELAAGTRELANLELVGLMTVPPFTADPEGARPYFRRLWEWNERLGLSVLSMGMSHDFEVAIEEGSTIVRVGTAIFGERGTGPE